MKEILLTQSLTTQVDDEDYDFLNQWKWYAFKTPFGYYAVRNSKNSDLEYNKRSTIFMHKILLNISNNSLVEGDHIDRNKLNNQRYNLRRAMPVQNCINRIYNTTSGYRGVSYHKQHNKFRVSININNKRKHLGYTDTAIEGAILYNKFALKYHGEFAMLNIIL